MAFTVQTKSVLNNEYVNLWIERTLLEHVVQLTVFDQFAMMGTLPGGEGSLIVRYLKQGAGGFSNVVTLTEGTPISTSRGLTLANIDVTLLQYGEVVVVSDILLKTQTIDTLKFATITLGEDCALQADFLQVNELGTNQVTVGNIRYAQQITSFANLTAATKAGGSAQINDFLDCFTRLENTRAPRIDGAYVAIIAPAVRRDILKDQTFLTPAQYGDSKRIFKGEIGEFYGVRFVITTNPYLEAVGTQFVYNAAGTIITSVVTGKQGWGFVKLAAMDPNLSSSNVNSATPTNVNPSRPKIYMVTAPDHLDPLGQQVIIGYKFFAAAKSLDFTWYCTLRSQTQFA